MKAIPVTASLLIASATVALPQAPPELVPIWTLSTRGGQPVVVHNEFDSTEHSRLTFPLKVIEVRESRLPTPEHRMELPYSAVLPIDATGKPVGQLNYVPSPLVAHGPFGDEPLVVFDSSERRRLSGHVSGFDPLTLSGTALDQFREWCPSVRDGLGVLLTLTATIVLRADLGRVILRIPHPGGAAAFSHDADIGVALVFHLAAGSSELGPEGAPSSLVVFDYDGRIIYESPELPANRGYSQLYVANDGRWIVATQQGADVSTIATDEVHLIDVQSGTTVSLKGMSGGNRFHSRDGRFMTITQGGWGRIQLFDLQNPNAAVRLWERKYAGVVGATAVSEDGPLVAALVASGVPGRPEEKVVLLDREGNVVANMRHYADNNHGLMFVGEYLFVGLQTHPLPAYVDVESTYRIDAYAVGSLGR